MDPFSCSNQPFLNLLNSQQFPQDPNNHISLSQINFSQESHQTGPIPNSKEKRRLWSAAEDVVLCSAWLNISKDAIVGNEQKNGTFWDRVADYVNASPATKGGKCNTGVTCKNRWAKINEGVSKFVGVLETATRNKKSGENDDNVVSDAYKIYQNDNKKAFNLEHAWLVLRNEQKWCSSLTANAGASSKRKVVIDDEASSPPPDGVVEPRPKGVKAAKNKNKKPRSETFNSDVSANALEAYEKMHALKERDFTLKNVAARTTLLNNLLAKTEPLTELEHRLKDKLIEEILNQ